MHLARGDDCFLIWYAGLDHKSKLAKAGGGFDDIPTKLINPIVGDIQSLAGLSKRMDAIVAEQTIIHVIGLMLVAVLLGWFIRELTASRSSVQRLGDRRLHLIDCQNLFYKILEYARAAHPEVAGLSGRTRMEHAYRIDPLPMEPIVLPRSRRHARLLQRTAA